MTTDQKKKRHPSHLREPLRFKPLPSAVVQPAVDALIAAAKQITADDVTMLREHGSAGIGDTNGAHCFFRLLDGFRHDVVCVRHEGRFFILTADSATPIPEKPGKILGELCAGGKWLSVQLEGGVVELHERGRERLNQNRKNRYSCWYAGEKHLHMHAATADTPSPGDIMAQAGVL